MSIETLRLEVENKKLQLEIINKRHSFHMEELEKQIELEKLRKENNQSPQKQKIGKEETLGKSVSYADTPNNSEDTHSTKQGGHWEETEYQDGCHTHKDNVWVEDTKQELNKGISKDYEQKI